MDPLARPIFIVAPPQSGSTYLYGALGRSPSVRRLGSGERAVFDQAGALEGAARSHDSNRRTAADATPESSARLRDDLLSSLSAAEDHPPLDGPQPRLLGATPRNALRVPFLNAAFPDASFVYVYREFRDTLASMVEAWLSGGYVTYPELSGWPGPPWSMLLVPGWRELAGRPIPEIAAAQWAITTETLLDDLEELPPERWCVSDLGALVTEPKRELDRLAEFLGIEPIEGDPGDPRDDLLRPSTSVHENPEALQAALERWIGLAERAHALIGAPVSRRPTAAAEAESPSKSTYTPRLTRILDRIGGSLLLTTRDAGQFLCVRHDGTRLNIHMRRLRGAMAVAAAPGRVVVGALGEVLEYQESQTALEQIASSTPGPPDACYVPRHRHYTGDVDIQDLALAAGGPWLVATRFDCLATLAPDHSMVPRWQPPFVEGTAGEDRCHLSGLAVDGSEVAYVTALGETSVPGGWREGRADGGCVVNVRENRTIATGLSLPCSPRLHRGRLWLLEAGAGALCAMDPAGGKVDTVALLPGFTRGLALVEGIAFVGVSGLRPGEEDLPLAARVDEAVSGLWAVDIEQGEILAYLRFEEDVEEVFGVAYLPGHRFPQFAVPRDQGALTGFSLPVRSLNQASSGTPKRGPRRTREGEGWI